jgi:hypothetical protein
MEDTGDSVADLHVFVIVIDGYQTAIAGRYAYP